MIECNESYAAGHRDGLALAVKTLTQWAADETDQARLLKLCGKDFRAAVADIRAEMLTEAAEQLTYPKGGVMTLTEELTELAADVLDLVGRVDALKKRINEAAGDAQWSSRPHACAMVDLDHARRNVAALDAPLERALAYVETLVTQ